jgi:hypothetical protein
MASASHPSSSPSPAAAAATAPVPSGVAAVLATAAAVNSASPAVPPKFAEDIECAVCKVQFGLITRRHHCRYGSLWDLFLCVSQAKSLNAMARQKLWPIALWLVPNQNLNPPQI